MSGHMQVLVTPRAEDATRLLWDELRTRSGATRSQVVSKQSGRAGQASIRAMLRNPPIGQINLLNLPIGTEFAREL